MNTISIKNNSLYTINIETNGINNIEPNTTKEFSNVTSFILNRKNTYFPHFFNIVDDKIELSNKKSDDCVYYKVVNSLITIEDIWKRICLK